MSTTMDKSAVQERVAWSERRLRNGDILKYSLTVLQQPERARACGQGAKSHADRRPVDPPPVVELRLFQGENQEDVTMSYNSNFFLFATLENARPIANGRVPVSPANQPVLTGVPVSGMAYLDRPVPAGYFIFPDLSVRHEGKYRLHFALFEECKEEDDRMTMSNPEVTHFRLEVKSKPFVVYSAKKFPGLAESTVLSRVVAEQGCRVRIRRDVRMRRRSEKSTGGDESLEDQHMGRGHRGETPERAYVPPAIPTIPETPAPPPVEKRQEPILPAQQQQQQPQDYRMYSDRTYVPTPQYIHNQQQQQQQQQQQHQQQHQQQMVAPPVPSVPAPVYQQMPVQEVRSGPKAQEVYTKRRDSDYVYFQTPQYGTVPPTPTAERYYNPKPQQYNAPPPPPPHPSAFVQPSQPATRSAREDLPPLKLAALEPPLSSALNSPSSATPQNNFMPPRSTVMSQPVPLPSQPPPPYTPQSATSSSTPIHAQPPPAQAPSYTPTYSNADTWAMTAPKIAVSAEPGPRHAGNKRGWDQTFTAAPLDTRLQNGARPSYEIDADDAEDEEIDFAKMRMSYRRADGLQIVRNLPDVTDLS